MPNCSPHYLYKAVKDHLISYTVLNTIFSWVLNIQRQNKLVLGTDLLERSLCQKMKNNKKVSIPTFNRILRNCS